MRYKLKPNIQIRIGANHDAVTVDGHTFDRSKMLRAEKNKLARLVVGGLTTGGYFEVRRG
jgi:hypothetical protein